jgi:hypothetical protein
MRADRPPLHLVLGDAAAALLFLAASRHGVPGEVHCIADDLGHGPLHDGVARMKYMRRCYQSSFEWTHTGTDAFADWRALSARLERQVRDVVVWRAANVSETVLLAMACWRLRETIGRLAVVTLPDGRHAGTRSPAELAALFAGVRPLSSRQRAEWAARFEALRDDDGVRRRWLGRRVVTAPETAFDGLVEQACGPDWQAAARVVANAMGAADPRDGLSDVFVASRLMALIRAGSIAADRSPRRLRDYRVRLATRAAGSG